MKTELIPHRLSEAPAAGLGVAQLLRAAPAAE
jgi:hypothetical protein